MPTDDPPDLDGLTEHPATAAATLADRAAAAVPWPEPRPLDAPPPPPPYPVEALPAWLRAMVCAVADALQTPVDLPGAMALPLVGAALCHRVEASPGDGWREPPALYVLAIARAGELKSPMLAALRAPVDAAERAARERVDPLRREALATRKILTARIDALTRAVAADKFPRSDLDAAEAELAALYVPSTPVYTIGGDATPESLAALLAEQGERMLVAAAEGGAVDALCGLRYAKTAGTVNMDLVLQSHGGEPVTIHRATRDPVYLRGPLLSLALATQPRVLEVAAGNPDIAARGMLARMLVAWPESRVGSRDTSPRHWPAGVREEYAARMTALWGEAVARDEHGAPTPAVYTFSADARALFYAWRGALESMRAPGGEYATSEALTAASAKLDGACVRIACILHAADRTDSDGLDLRDTVITEETVARAIRVAEYFGVQAVRAYARLTAADPAEDDARALLLTLRQRPPADGTLSIREATARRNGGTAERALAALDVLADHGYLRPLPPPPRAGVGRPPSPRYELHPALRPAPPPGAPPSNSVNMRQYRQRSPGRVRIPLTPRVSP